MPVYYDQFGQKKNANFTTHSLERFTLRYELVYGFQPPKNIYKTINAIFESGEVVKNPDKEQQKHINKSGCIYIRSGSFDFVVIDKSVVTVEICTNSLKHLNKIKKIKRDNPVAA